MEPIQPSTTRSYLDFDGLGKLRGQARKDEKSALRETAQQFEAMFLQMMIKSMREASVKGDLTESNGADTFESMFDREVSVAMSKRGATGLADMLVKTQTQRIDQQTSTADALLARQAGTDKGADKGIALERPSTLLPLNAPGAPLAPLVRPGGPMSLVLPATSLDRSGK